MQKKKKIAPFLKENVDDADVWKRHPFDAFFGHGCVASHVAIEPPGIRILWVRVGTLD